jgi:catechol 2,3-dioxygenase-like lactoylglutathione lyase family enzyme
MFSHVMIGADDLDAARAFYDATFAALGIATGVVDAKGRLLYATETGRFLVTRPIDGEAASGANGGTIGFLAASPNAADAWRAAGLAHGGTEVADAPTGVRRFPDGRAMFVAYLRDPAGNKLCALHRIAA